MSDLWKRWREHHKENGFAPEKICEDGIVDESLYGESSVKLLFVMKDANKWPGGDLKHLLKSGMQFQTWHTVARWATGALGGFPDFDTIQHDGALMHNSLKRIAAINLKKQSGAGVADIGIVGFFAGTDKELIKEQVLEIAPNVIIACGTFEFLTLIFDGEIPNTPYAQAYKIKNGDFWVIRFRHPNRADNRLSYDELKRAFEDIQSQAS